MSASIRRSGARRTAVLALALAAVAAAVPARGRAAETPHRGGILLAVIAAEPPSLDPHQEGTFANIQLVAPFYSTLLQFNPVKFPEIIGDLATEWKISPDGLTYTFKVRQGVKFHDGSPLTAADVAASWQEIVHPRDGVSSARESYFIMVDKVEAPDATTVVFRLKFATNAFLPSLADPYAWIYKKEILDKDPHWFEKNIMGSGPFKFAGYEIGQSIKGVRNPDYYHMARRRRKVSSVSVWQRPPAGRRNSMTSPPSGRRRAWSGDESCEGLRGQNFRLRHPAR